MPDFTSYVPPDVYIEEERVSLVSVIGVDPSVVAIVGPALGFRSNVDAVTLTGTNDTLLSKLGINQATVVVRDASGQALTVATDYVLTAGTGLDAIAATADDTLSIHRVGGGSITDGETVYVSYDYTDPNYLAPQRFNRYQDIVEFYGEPIDLTTGEVLSPLSLAAQIAITNGANSLVLVNVGTDVGVTAAELTAGVAMLDSFYDVDLVVVLPVGIANGDADTVAQNAETSANTALTNGVRRHYFVGFDTGVTLALDTIAGYARNERVVVAGPERMLYFIGPLNREIEIGSMYLGAAYAGIAVRQGVEQPLTKKLVRGFSGIPGSIFSRMTGTYKNTLSDSGVMLTEKNRSGQLVIRHGVTTDRTDILSREFSLVRTKDALVDLIRETMERAGLIGGVVDDDALARVKSVIDGCLMAAKTAHVIRDYIQPVVRQQSANPTIVEVKFQYDPLYPMNYIVVSFSINTTTGETSNVANPAA